MRVLVVAGLLAGPTALAFDTAGFYDRARTVAGVAAWVLVALLALDGGRIPRSRPAAFAFCGLAGLTAWTAISTDWAPLMEPARDDVGRLLLYLGVFTASALAWRQRAEARLIEPLLALGCLVVAGYGLSGRLLPDLIDLHQSLTAAGRLEQPLTYWNGMGVLAAFGMTLAIRLAGDRSRPDVLRASAAAACAPLGMAVYLSFSRGALTALGAGIVILISIRPTPAQGRAIAVGLAAGGLAALASSFLPGVESLSGGARARDGAVGLVVLVILATTAAFVQRSWGSSEDGAAERRLPSRAVALTAVTVLLAGPLVAAAGDRGTTAPAPGASPGRLAEVGSNRYDYWDVAVSSFADEPLRGVGTSGFRVEWLREREIDETVSDAHSLYLETGAELGIVGLALLTLFVGGVIAAARQAIAADRALVAGWAAGAAVIAVHAGIDFDWEIPAVMLPALVLAGALVARASPTSRGGGAG